MYRDCWQHFRRIKGQKIDLTLFQITYLLIFLSSIACYMLLESLIYTPPYEDAEILH